MSSSRLLLWVNLNYQLRNPAVTNSDFSLQFFYRSREATNWLTPRNKVLPEKLTAPHLVKKFPAVYETRRFIITFTSYLHMSVSWARSILVLLLQLRLGLRSGFLPPHFKLKSCMHLSRICATCPAHLILLDGFTRIIFGEKSSV